VPKATTLPALNAYFRARCASEAGRTVAGYAESIGQRFGRDRAEAFPLPPRPFDACVLQAAQADKCQTVRFDRNRYSVPRPCAYPFFPGILAGAWYIPGRRHFAGYGPGDPLSADRAGAGREPASARLSRGRHSPLLSGS
jgi:hypothetical protein